MKKIITIFLFVCILITGTNITIYAFSPLDEFIPKPVRVKMQDAEVYHYAEAVEQTLKMFQMIQELKRTLEGDQRREALMRATMGGSGLLELSNKANEQDISDWNYKDWVDAVNISYDKFWSGDAIKIMKDNFKSSYFYYDMKQTKEHWDKAVEYWNYEYPDDDKDEDEDDNNQNQNNGSNNSYEKPKDTAIPAVEKIVQKRAIKEGLNEREVKILREKVKKQIRLNWLNTVAAQLHFKYDKFVISPESGDVVPRKEVFEEKDTSSTIAFIMMADEELRKTTEKYFGPKGLKETLPNAHDQNLAIMTAFNSKINLKILEALSDLNSLLTPAIHNYLKEESRNGVKEIEKSLQY